MTRVDALGPAAADARPIDRNADGLEVTVVIATRDRWRFLRRTLAAASAQTDVRFEIVVVDDASIDETPARLAEVRDPAVRVVRNPRSLGPSSARNAGIAMAKGEWIAFLDDDDLWAPRKLRAQLDAARSTDALFVYAGAAVIDEDAVAVRVWPFPDPADLMPLLLRENVVPGGASNPIAKTQLVRAVGGFDERLAYAADWDLWITLAAAAPVAGCPEVLIGYQRHSGNTVNSMRREEILDELRYLRDKHRPLARAWGVRFDPIATTWLWDEWRRQTLLRAAAHLRAGRRIRAARDLAGSAWTYRSWRDLWAAAGALTWTKPDATQGRRASERNQRSVPQPGWLELHR